MKARINAIVDEYIIRKVIVWRDYTDRSKGVSMRLKHNKKVKVVAEYDGYVKIKRWFKIGFVNKDFLELNNG